MPRCGAPASRIATRHSSRGRDLKTQFDRIAAELAERPQVAILQIREQLVAAALMKRRHRQREIERVARRNAMFELPGPADLDQFPISRKDQETDVHAGFRSGVK